MDDPSNDPLNDNTITPFPPRGRAEPETVIDLDTPVSEMLLSAVSEMFTEAIVIGRLPNGDLFIDYTLSSPAEANFLLDRCKEALLSR